MATCNWVMLGGFVALLGLPGSAAAQPADADQATSLDRLRAAPAAGKVKEIDLDRGQLKIADAPPLSAAIERPALMTAAVVPARGGAALAPPPAPPSRRLSAEVKQRVRDLESCRGGARTGQIQLRWRILPDGRTTNALVLEQQPTDMDVMKCARRRIEAWRFLTATAVPVDVELAYDFARTDKAAATAAAPATPATARSTATAATATAATAPIASDSRGRTTTGDESEGKGRPRANAGEAKVGEAKVGEARLNEARLEEGK
jgi:hypothetical protein